MFEELAMPLVMVSEIGEVLREIHARDKVLKIAGHAHIDRIPLHVDKSRIRKDGVYELRDSPSWQVSCRSRAIVDLHDVSSRLRYSAANLVRVGRSSNPFRTSISSIRVKFQKSISPAPDDRGMRCEYLLRQRRAGAGHAYDKYRFDGRLEAPSPTAAIASLE